MGHGIADLLDDHGADARKSFHDFLKQKYGGLAAVSQRYAASYASWDDVPFPELATFFGYEGDAIDLSGMWKMSTTAAYDAGSAAPGPRRLLLARRARAGARASCASRRASPPSCAGTSTSTPPGARNIPGRWLYCWDLENTRDKPVNVFVNGVLCPENPPMRRGWHFSRVEVTGCAQGRRQPHHPRAADRLDRLPHLHHGRAAGHLSRARDHGDERPLRRLVGLVLVVPRAGPAPRACR